jgi:hypothetical protein
LCAGESVLLAYCLQVADFLVVYVDRELKEELAVLRQQKKEESERRKAEQQAVDELEGAAPENAEEPGAQVDPLAGMREAVVELEGTDTTCVERFNAVLRARLSESA